MEPEEIAQNLIARVNDPGDIQRLLEEMIEDEEKFGSFTKGSADIEDPGIKLVLDVFNRERSQEVIRIVRNLEEVSAKYGDKGEPNFLKDSIFAKAAHDWSKMQEQFLFKLLQLMSEEEQQ